ncbi:MAG: outer membrane lipoprotein-sorting protein [Myxococcota bacterium]
MLALLLASLAGALAAAPTPTELVDKLKTIDDRQQNSGDWTSLVFIEQKEQGKSDLVYQAVVYRRDESDKLALLFTKPQSEAGKGYLRVDNNLFFYDPAVGKWERRTERERIGGTNSNRQDFDQSRLAEEYDPTYVDAGQLGKFAVDHLKLAGKSGVDVAYPTVELWLDQATGNVLKRQDFAVSGKLVRTTYYPQWNKLYSESKKAEVYFPKEIRIFDEVQKGNTTTVVIQEVDLKSLDDAIFTKAYLESKSR